MYFRERAGYQRTMFLLFYDFSEQIVVLEWTEGGRAKFEMSISEFRRDFDFVRM